MVWHMKMVKHPPGGGRETNHYLDSTVRYRQILQRAVDREDVVPSLDIEMLKQFLISPSYYNGNFGAQKITDEAGGEFLALAVWAVGYEAPDAWTP